MSRAKGLESRTVAAEYLIRKHFFSRKKSWLREFLPEIRRPKNLHAKKAKIQNRLRLKIGYFSNSAF